MELLTIYYLISLSLSKQTIENLNKITIKISSTCQFLFCKSLNERLKNFDKYKNLVISLFLS